MITAPQLKLILPACKATDAFALALNQCFQKFDISTPQRVCCFIGQTAHESNSFNNIQENLNYNADQLVKLWPKLFTGNTSVVYAHQPEKIANRIYANRIGNGNELSGEGWKYRGRGVIQITGKANYKQIGDLMGIDLVNNPDLLLTVTNAVISAGAYWSLNKLNQYADKNDFTGLTKKINGGLLGLDERLKIYNTAKNIIK